VKRRQKVWLILSIIIIAGLVFGPDLLSQNYRGPFKGQVLDADTREPIEGAVVFVRWTETHFFSRATFYDASEILTDKKGMFNISKKWSWNPWTNLVMDSRVIVYKAGYGVAQTHWNPIKDAARILRHLLLNERGKAGAGCGQAVGDVKFILQCFSLEEQERHNRISYSDIKLENDSPLFLLKKLNTIRERSMNASRIDPGPQREHIPELLNEEIAIEKESIRKDFEANQEKGEFTPKLLENELGDNKNLHERTMKRIR